MRFNNVQLSSIGYCLPQERVSSEEIESRLGPLYDRLRLPHGRLELISGIKERRFWQPGTLPSTKSIESGQRAISASGIDRSEIGALIHASVCRDHLEPATACRVHHELGLRPDCLVYDVSNACLGIINGTIQVAQMIELGQIQAGLVVGTESARQLVETTIRTLNADLSLTRASVKTAVASLTIGSGSCAFLLTASGLGQGSPIIAASAWAHTVHHGLCQSGADESVAGGMQPLMNTDSERLLAEGIATGRACFERLKAAARWDNGDFSKSVCHQVGSAHQKRMLEELGLDRGNDYATYPWLGNTGSVALPLTLAFAGKSGHLENNDQIGMFGIGSGINSVMLASLWKDIPISGDEGHETADAANHLEYQPQQIGGPHFDLEKERLDRQS